MMHEAERVRLARQLPPVLLAANDGLLLISGISRGRSGAMRGTGGAVTPGGVTALPSTAACQAPSRRFDVVRGEWLCTLEKPKFSEARGEEYRLAPGSVSPGILQPRPRSSWDRTRDVWRCRRKQPKLLLSSKSCFRPFSSPGFTPDSESQGWRGWSPLSEFFPARLLCQLPLWGSVSVGAGLLAGCSRLPRTPAVAADHPSEIS